jgi:hypothetical protein
VRLVDGQANREARAECGRGILGVQFFSEMSRHSGVTDGTAVSFFRTANNRCPWVPFAERGLKVRREDMRRLLPTIDGKILALPSMNLLLEQARIRAYRVR